MRGIDVASYQGIVPWHTLHNVDFGVVKVTEGENYVNPYWQTNAANLRVENKLRGFYYFSIPGLKGNTPEAEAVYFWSKIEHFILPGDIIACDVEKTNYNDAKRTSTWVYKSLSYLKKLAKFTPLIYSYPDFITLYLTDRKLSEFPLWLAWYKDNLPKSFQQWSRIALWQRGPGTIPGITGQVDIDIFFLGAEKFKEYGKPA